jgi:hypothetical protein
LANPQSVPAILRKPCHHAGTFGAQAAFAHGVPCPKGRMLDRAYRENFDVCAVSP